MKKKAIAIIFISISIISSLPVSASTAIYGCVPFEKDGYEVPASDVKRERGLLMPALQIFDNEINLIVGKKLWGAAKYTKTTYPEQASFFDSIDTYTYQDKNLNIEMDLIKKDGELLFREDGNLRVTTYFASDGWNSMVYFSCEKLKL
jgi:hypothetical protein